MASGTWMLTWNITVFLVLVVTRVRIDISTKFQMLYAYFQVCLPQCRKSRPARQPSSSCSRRSIVLLEPIESCNLHNRWHVWPRVAKVRLSSLKYSSFSYTWYSRFQTRYSILDVYRHSVWPVSLAHCSILIMSNYFYLTDLKVCLDLSNLMTSQQALTCL